jgi:hypothetical protein
LKIESEAEARAMMAFDCKIPRLLHTDRGQFVKKGESHLKKLPTHAEWGSGGCGLKEKFTEDLASVEQAFYQQIDDQLEAGSVAHATAMLCLAQTVAWIGDFKHFVDETFASLTRHRQFSDANAWSLTTKLMHRVFSDLHAARAGVIPSLKPGDNASICSHILWGVFCTHDVMAEYRKMKFRDHPAISSEYVKFLASNNSGDLLESVNSKMSAVESKLKEMTSEMQKINTTAGLAQNRAAEVKKSVEDHHKRINKLENK